MSNYMIHCLQNIESMSYSDPLMKRQKQVSVSVTGLVDAFQEEQGQTSGTLDYKNYGNFA